MSVVYRNCVVPKCRSSVQRTPDKLFIHVPIHQDIRNKWLKLAGRKNEFSPKSPIYFCSDHFDLERDMENYMEYKVMGFVKKVKLIKECLPTKFDCQDENKKSSITIVRGQTDDKSILKSPTEKRPRLLSSECQESDPLLPISLMVQLPMIVEDEKESSNEIEEGGPPLVDQDRHISTSTSASTSNITQDVNTNPIHYLDFIAATTKKLKPTKQCRVCLKNKIRKRTRYYCPTCPNQPPLCVGICYKHYHENSMI